MIKIEVNSKVKDCLLPIKELEKIVQAAAKKEKRIKGVVELNIIGESEMTKLNFKFRGKKYPTDVLSFSYGEDKFFQGEYLGEIYLCPKQVARLAKELGIDSKQEFARMFTHGLLHLSGHDHHEIDAAKKMFTLQEKILKELKYVR